MNQSKQRDRLLPAFQKWLLMIVILGLATMPALAQTKTITGRVRDDAGNPVAGATVREKGTKGGVATDAEGRFHLTVKPGGTLMISSVGIESREINVGEGSDYDIHVKTKQNSLNEVVVTALGIRREKRELTYSTQQIKGDELTGTKEPGLLNAMDGKVSGVQITSSSGQPGAATRILIRGSSSLLGNNEALIVLDGVPIDNSATGNPSGGGGGSGQSRLSDIDPSTVESINVLKGSAASALYGSSAARGVILITTKAGALNTKPKVTLNSQWQVDNGILPQTQIKYAQGDRDVYKDGNTPATQTSAVWGPPVDSLMKAGLVTYHKNPLKAFLTSGHTYTNTATVSGGGERSSYFFSYSNLDQTGIVPTTTYKRNAMFIKSTNKITDQLTATFQLNWTLSNTHTLPEGYDLTDPLWTVITAPSTWNPLPYLDAQGNQRVFRASRNNPFWDLNNVYTNNKVSRFIPVITLNYKPTSWLTITERGGADTYSEQPDYFEAPSKPLLTTGKIVQQSDYFRQFNNDLIITGQKQWGNFNTSLVLGNNIFSSYTQNHILTGTGTAIANFDNVTNGSTIVGSEAYYQTRKVGFYAQANVDYKSFLNLSLTGRYDGTSLLAASKNWYPYGSASAGFIFSELMKDATWLNMGKLRVSYSIVGNDNIQPYSLTTPYAAAFNFPYNAVSGFNQSTTLGNPYLHDELTKEAEVGLEMNFLQNRLGFEVSYFSRNHDNLLTSGIPIAPSTGYAATSLNAAYMTNKGVEALVNITPVKSKNFRWDMTLTYTRIRNMVTRINGGVPYINIGQTWAFVGKPNGVYYNYGYERDSATHQIMVDSKGLPVTSANQEIIGNMQRDYEAGMNNSFSWKNWTASFFLDFSKGGQIMNSDDRYGFFYGTPKVTENRQPRIVPGLVQGTGQQNAVTVQAEDYYQRLNTNYEAAIQDITFLKLRTASIGYRLPNAMIEKSCLSTVGLTLTGRNLFIYKPHFTGSDPEVSSYGTGDGSVGLYGNTVPTSRSFNLTLNIGFK